MLFRNYFLNVLADVTISYHSTINLNNDTKKLRAYAAKAGVLKAITASCEADLNPGGPDTQRIAELFLRQHPRC